MEPHGAPERHYALRGYATLIVVAACLCDSGQRGAKAREGPEAYIPRLASTFKRISTTSSAAGSSPLSCAQKAAEHRQPRGETGTDANMRCSVRARRGRRHGTWDPISAPQCGVSVGIGVTCAASVGVDTGILCARPLSPTKGRAPAA